MAKRPWYKPTVKEVLVLLALFALALSIAMPSLHRMSLQTGRLPCPSNLKQIGQAILLYANENAGFCPPDLAMLIPTQDQTEEVLHCPTSAGKPSYVYVAAGQRFADLGDTTVVCFEPRECHDGDGSNVLFGDGHVEWLYETSSGSFNAKEIRRQLDAGIRPIRLEQFESTSRPTTEPQ